MVKKISKYLYLFILCALFFGALWIRKIFGNVTFDEILFQITNPVEGTNKTMVYQNILSLIFPALISSICLMIILYYNSKYSINLSVCFKKKKKEFTIYPLNSKKRKIIITILTIMCIIFGLYKLDIFDFIKNSNTPSTFIEENYVDPKSSNIVFPDKKKNLIIIFLESMENSYASKEYGGISDYNLIPNLTNLANENISFSNTDKLGGALYTYGASWTSAAMSTQLSGVPYKVSLNINNLNNKNEFLPGIYNLGDILKDNGYNNELLIGSKARFGNREALFKTHGDYFIFDWAYMVNEGLKNESDHNDWWGLEDSELFEYAKIELGKLSKDDKPFNLTMLTVDTHFEDGFLSSKCENKYNDHYENVINCNDKMIYDFISWIKSQDFYKDTTIILVGDHQTMDVDFFDKYNNNYIRTNYNVFINSSVTSSNTKNRIFMSFDIFPTILSSIGVTFDNNRLGIGTDLFSNSKTLAEEYGYDYVLKQIKYKSNFYNQNFINK